MSEFFQMGGYGAYVWPAYGISAVVLLGLFLLSLRSMRLSERSLAALDSQRPQRRRPPRPDLRNQEG